MVDWPGLLKFSLTHSDGTHKTEFKEMDAQRRKWLEEAVNQYTMAEVRRIQQILKELNKPESNSQQDAMRRTALLEQMEQLIESMDKGETLYQLGGHFIILNIIFNSKYTENRLVAMRVFCFANQNDAKVQEESIRVGSFEFMERIPKETNPKIKEGFLSCVSNLIRGENLQAKRIFLRLNGLLMIGEVLMDQPTQRMKSKCCNIIRDLLYYDDHLHKTHNDLSSFTNTNSIKVKTTNTDIEFDANKTVTNNEMPDNVKFRGSVKKWLADNGQVRDIYQAILKEEQAS